MKKNNLSRKQFLQRTLAATGALLIAPTTLPSNVQAQAKKTNMPSVPELLPKQYVLQNVLLETGFEHESKRRIISTQAIRTALYDVQVQHGKITNIQATSERKTSALPTFDMQGLLLMPAFRDMHVHVDKMYYADGWHATKRADFTIKDMINLERTLSKTPATTVEKIDEAITQMKSKGTYFARFQCAVSPMYGAENIVNLQAALAKHKKTFAWEIVAFPQHGIRYSRSASLLKRVAQMNVDFIGGLDPTSVDEQMEKSMDVMCKTALDYGKGIDMHLHETGRAGLDALHYLIKKVRTHKALQHKTYVSHAFVLADLNEKELRPLCEQFAELGIAIITTMPTGYKRIPLSTLQAHGVKVMTGTDSMMDHWSPFASCDMLEKAQRYTQFHGATDAFALSRALRLSTQNGVLPLSDHGERAFPAVDMDATFILVPARSTAEAVACLPTRKLVVFEGKNIAGASV